MQEGQPQHTLQLDLAPDQRCYSQLQPAQGSASRITSYQRSIRSLPVPPALWQKFQQACDADASSQKLADIIKDDPVLSAAILRSSNSAGLGLRAPINNIARAIAYLGNSMIRSVVVCHSFSSSLRTSGKAYDMSQLWKHGMAVSTIAEAIAEDITDCNREDAGTLGLFHDIGRMSFNLLTEFMLPATLDNEKGHLSFEKQRFGCTHIEMGVVLAEHWELPEKVIAGIKYHHHPALAEADTIPDSVRPEVLAVYLADILAIHLGFSGGDDGIAFPLDSYAPLLANIDLAALAQNKRITSELARIEALEF